MSDHHEANDRAFRSAEDAYLREPAWLPLLTRLDACDEAIEWARSLPTTTTAAEAWAQCPRGDWLVWLLGRLHVRGVLTRQRLVMVSCAARRTAEAECVALLDTTERWCRGEATIDDVVAARRAERNAYYATAAYADADAAAADAAYADAYGVGVGAYYAAYDAAAYDAAYAAYARRKSLAATADAVRGVIPWSEVEAAITGCEAPARAEATT